MKKRLLEIRELIALDNLSRATQRIMDLCHDFSSKRETQNSALIIRSEFNSIQNEVIKIGPSENAHRRRNVLISRALDFLDEVLIEYEENPQNHLPELPLLESTAFITQGPSDLNEKHIAVNEELKTILLLKNIKKTYADFILEADEIELKEGEILGIVGKNGSGKSSLIKIIAGVIKPTRGDLIYNLGEDDDYNSKKHIFYLPQDIPFRGEINIVEYLKYSFAKNGIKGDANEALVDQVLYRLNLQRFKDRTWKELSGGYRLRLELAKAFGIRPKLLILDEPFANLDILTLDKVMRDIVDFAKSVKTPSSVIISSQHLFEIEHIADKIIYLDEGEIKFYGDLNEIGDSGYRYYDIVCDLKLEVMHDVISAISKDFQLLHNGFKYTLLLPVHAQVKPVFQAISSRSDIFTYYLDFSKSVKKFFIDNND